MVIITGTIKFESAAEVARIKAALVRRAERSRADAGNIDYAFSHSLEDPTELRLVEKWADEASLNAHLQLPDAEFDAVLSSAKIASASVLSNEAGAERVLLER